MKCQPRHFPIHYYGTAPRAPSAHAHRCDEAVDLEFQFFGLRGWSVQRLQQDSRGLPRLLGCARHARAAEANWPTKFKLAFDLADANVLKNSMTRCS